MILLYNIIDWCVELTRGIRAGDQGGDELQIVLQFCDQATYLLLFSWLSLVSELTRSIPENRSRTTFSDPACFDFCGERGIRTPGTVTRTAV